MEEPMPKHEENATAPEPTQSDPELLALVRAGQPFAFRLIMRRYNRRLYRIARGIVRDDSLAEDVLQEAYLLAFRHLDDFNGKSTFSTWLTRIVMNEALGRLRKAGRTPEVHLGEEGLPGRVLDFPSGAALDNPEITMAQRQILKLVEAATDELPEEFRIVFIARVIEEMTVEETAELLSLKPETVRSRLHRARAVIRGKLDRMIGPIAVDAFPFAGWQCEQLTERIMRQLFPR
ncbi:RNA polymerase sigma factor protein (plasmid) [Rhizobium grahamii CCGE 502]|uniref:RNA polymerase sigma factor n=2 Tax=Rhizobium grahamii TaxID=1120045 RepID=S3H8A1_9HYPH|nr:RNA polymerase sigma factor protein [Rhizobium grahamii CCGE 502]